MSPASNMATYLNHHYQGKTPEQLIHMLYKGALQNLSLAKEGFTEDNPKKRGEHLGKAIAIISELYSSLDKEIQDESVQFLAELYSNMLTELPKISINHDIKALDLTYSYMKQLNHIWETQVLNTPPKQKPNTGTKPDPVVYNSNRGDHNSRSSKSLIA